MCIWGKYRAASKCTHDYALVKHPPGGPEDTAVWELLLMWLLQGTAVLLCRCSWSPPQDLDSTYFSKSSNLHSIMQIWHLARRMIWLRHKGNWKRCLSGCVGGDTKSISQSAPVLQHHHVNHWLRENHVWLLHPLIQLKTPDNLPCKW